MQAWRVALGSTQPDNALQSLHRLIAERLQVRCVALTWLDRSLGHWDTIALSPRSREGSLPGVSSCTRTEAGRAARLLKTGEALYGPADRVRAQLPGLIAGSIVDDVLVVMLGLDDTLLGALTLVAERKRPFAAADAKVARLLHEPLSAALAHYGQVRELAELRQAAEADRRSLLSRLGRTGVVEEVVGADAGLREVMQRVHLVARSDAPVLILGETGTGKEVVARAIHRESRRAGGPFLRVNCGAIPGELIDSELFGHERGSFTGAVSQRRGWFEQADGGTLFLDEVGELPLAAQVRLLRILQDGNLQRVGGERQWVVDVRVVAATNQDLHGMVAKGGFREDLWYRLAVFPVRLPPLRERVTDLPALAKHFAHRAATRLGLPLQLPNAADIELLRRYAWPGNVRELSAVIERAAILGNGHGLQIDTALGFAGPMAPEPELDEPGRVPELRVRDESMKFDDAVRQHIMQTLMRCHGRVNGPFGAAKLLDVNPSTLRARMRKLGIRPAQFK